jgi:hypothetical protein
MEFSDRTRKMWPFKTGDCLIEVTLDRAVLTIYLCENESLG